MKVFNKYKSTIKNHNLRSNVKGIQRSTLIAEAGFLALISAILTGMNITKRWWFMAATTGFLAIGFFVAAIFAVKKRKMTALVIMACLVALVFSVYAITGENEGFACLWILLVPIIATSLLGLKVGFFLSLYYQIFLAVLFYSPLRSHVAMHYTETFLNRFPILYFATFGGVMILALQKQYYLDKTVQQAYHDFLTGIYNRTYFMEQLDKYENEPNVTVGFFDLNRLKFINDSFGHDAGDEIICASAGIIYDCFAENSIVARMGGDEFAIISLADREDIDAQMKMLEKKCAAWKSRDNHDYELILSSGVASRKDFQGCTVGELIKEADRKMYKNKAAFYKQNRYDRRM